MKQCFINPPATSDTPAEAGARIVCHIDEVYALNVSPGI
jgi:hypothetical protein